MFPNAAVLTVQVFNPELASESMLNMQFSDFFLDLLNYGNTHMCTLYFMLSQTLWMIQMHDKSESHQCTCCVCAWTCAHTCVCVFMCSMKGECKKSEILHKSDQPNQFC